MHTHYCRDERNCASATKTFLVWTESQNRPLTVWQDAALIQLFLILAMQSFNSSFIFIAKERSSDKYLQKEEQMLQDCKQKSLQGIMGKEVFKKEKENTRPQTALRDHYLARFGFSLLPGSTQTDGL